MRAHELGANTFQIFSASPRMWRASPPSVEDATRMLAVREEYDLAPLVIHDNYLINLAAADPVNRRKSIDAFRGELERAVRIGAEYLVAHPGSYKDQDLESGIRTLVASLAEAASGIRSQKLTLLLENMAGQGASIGSKLEELREIRNGSRVSSGIRNRLLPGYLPPAGGGLQRGYPGGSCRHCAPGRRSAGPESCSGDPRQ